jgi:tyrosyl-tRNA synthetase
VPIGVDPVQDELGRLRVVVVDVRTGREDEDDVEPDREGDREEGREEDELRRPVDALSLLFALARRLDLTCGRGRPLESLKWRRTRGRRRRGPIMDLEERLTLVRRPPTEEVLTETELVALLATEAHPRHYIGLEISGWLHLGSLVILGFKINDFIKAGIRCKVFLADWHSYINNKLGADLGKIETVSRYYEEAFGFFCPGVEFELGSRLYEKNDQYWRDLLRFSKQITLARDTRCLTIMGRTTRDKLDVAQYIYPPMQATDIRAMGLDIAHSGMDQRKVHVLVREVFPSLGWKVPVAVHHHLLAGLQKPEAAGLDDEDAASDKVVSSKMSKSKPDSAIFIHDDAEEIARKMGKAWCPERQAEGNPVLDFARQIVFHEMDRMEVVRPEKYGGTVSYGSYADLERDYVAGKLHPKDLKQAVASSLDAVVAPVREHFKGTKILGEAMAIIQDDGRPIAAR